MRTAISPVQWQPWAAVSPLLGPHQHGEAWRKVLTTEHLPRRLLLGRVRSTPLSASSTVKINVDICLRL